MQPKTSARRVLIAAVSIAAFLSSSITNGTISGHAQEEVESEAYSEAENETVESDGDSGDELGEAPPPFIRYYANVRVTFYLPTGNRTYSGEWPYIGSAACSWNFAIGTEFVFPDGRSFRCNDRGLLGSAGWVDIYVPTYAYGIANVERVYGLYSTVGVR